MIYSLAYLLTCIDITLPYRLHIVLVKLLLTQVEAAVVTQSDVK